MTRYSLFHYDSLVSLSWHAGFRFQFGIGKYTVAADAAVLVTLFRVVMRRKAGKSYIRHRRTGV